MKGPGPLDLDYQRRRRAVWAGLAVLAIGLALASAVGVRYWKLQREVALWNAKAAEAERVAGRLPQAPRVAGDKAEIARQVKDANAVLRRLAVPWQALFAAIESSKGKEVALLTVNPDAEKGLVRIGAEAKGLDEMVRYLKRLQRQPALGEVVLLNHQVQEKDPQKPVRFSVTAAWAEQP